MRVALKCHPDERDQDHRLRGRRRRADVGASCVAARRGGARAGAAAIAPSVSASASWMNTGSSTRAERLVLPAVRRATAAEVDRQQDGSVGIAEDEEGERAGDREHR